MAIDPILHSIDPATGFAVGRDGHVVGLTPPVVRTVEPSEYPKWVVCHDSHVVRLDGKQPVAPLFPEFHVNRVNGEVTVLVRDEDEEKWAMSAKEESPALVLVPEPVPVPDFASGEFFEIGGPGDGRKELAPPVDHAPESAASDADAMAELEKTNPELAAKLKASLSHNGAN